MAIEKVIKKVIAHIRISIDSTSFVAIEKVIENVIDTYF